MYQDSIGMYGLTHPIRVSVFIQVSPSLARCFLIEQKMATQHTYMNLVNMSSGQY